MRSKMALSIIVGVALGLFGCSDQCVRHSDCQGGTSCVQGACVREDGGAVDSAAPAAVDAAAVDAGVKDASPG